MRVVTPRMIREFTERYPKSAVALNFWYETISTNSYTNITELRNDFNSVDYVTNDRYVFNIKGNGYRLVAIVKYASQKVYIRFIGTHKQYDEIDCSTI